ncbi:MAG: hypothetical protein U0570_05020 [Phycisphaerales bacterium]
MSFSAQIQDLLARRQFAAARPLLERAARGSSDAQVIFTLARVLLALGEREPAAYQAQRAIASASGKPFESQLRVAAGELLQECGKAGEAEKLFRETAARYPQLPTVRAAWINALRAAGRSGEAGDVALAALEQFPGDVLLHLIGAGALGESLRQSKARDSLLRAVEMGPPDHRVLIPAATMLHYCDGVDPELLTRIHRRAGESLARAAGPAWKPPARTGSGPLRVALVSCDFRDHAVARFLEPWLTGRTRGEMQVIGVSLLGPADATTERLRGACEEWIDASGKADDEIVRLVREAQADIAMDLSGLHVTARPMVFAKRVAPVQISYLGYAGTTGLPTMDYRLVDAVTDPPGAERLSSEKLLRLDGCFLCFGPDARTPEVTSSAERGAITFCSFNAQQKITETTLDLWAGALKAAPHAKLLLKGRSLSDARTRAILDASFSSRGIEPARVEVLAHAPDYASHLEQYNRADIALDTSPYCGTTTTCEALAMGVPVVTLAGSSHAARVGASLLRAAGLGECVASEAAGFAGVVKAQTDQLGTVSARAEHKRAISRRFRASALCDAEAYADRLHRVLRTVGQ